MSQRRSGAARQAGLPGEGDPWQMEFYYRIARYFNPNRPKVVCETGFNMGVSAALWLEAGRGVLLSMLGG